MFSAGAQRRRHFHREGPLQLCRYLRQSRLRTYKGSRCISLPSEPEVLSGRTRRILLCAVSFFDQHARREPWNRYKDVVATCRSLLRRADVLHFAVSTNYEREGDELYVEFVSQLLPEEIKFIDAEAGKHGESPFFIMKLAIEALEYDILLSGGSDHMLFPGTPEVRLTDMSLNALANGMVASFEALLVADYLGVSHGGLVAIATITGARFSDSCVDVEDSTLVRPNLANNTHDLMKEVADAVRALETTYDEEERDLVNFVVKFSGHSRPHVEVSLRYYALKIDEISAEELESMSQKKSKGFRLTIPYVKAFTAWILAKFNDDLLARNVQVERWKLPSTKNHTFGAAHGKLQDGGVRASRTMAKCELRISKTSTQITEAPQASSSDALHHLGSSRPKVISSKFLLAPPGLVERVPKSSPQPSTSTDCDENRAERHCLSKG